ncbi:MAG: DUF1800 family protein [Betaproteobacteria bacterium]
MKAVTGSTSSISHYAASRLLDQASMGATPETVSRVRTLGVAGWVDEQLRMPASRIVTPPSLIEYDLNLDQAANDRAWRQHRTALVNAAVANPDQLRTRVAWVLSNYLVVSTRKIQAYGGNEYWNTLMEGAFGSYGTLLKNITRSPAMGFYLDNSQNNRFNLNENYGRELMQLFSVGLVMLNMDGTPKRDASGKPIETYKQFDVIEATRTLTGWGFVENPESKKFRNPSNGFNYGKPMEATWSDGHDTGEKTVLGRKIASGGNAATDLDALIEILVTHPNTAPFVSLRIIQGLTTSDPAPAYVQRVASVFQQTKGDMAKVVKAALLDPEARMGDDPTKANANFGRIREPYLQHTSITRGLGCRSALMARNRPEEVMGVRNQMPLHAYSVFGFYPPNHRAPGSNLLAPEQKLLVSTEFADRLGRYDWHFQDEAVWAASGCDMAAFKQAAGSSDAELLELINQRFFRGAMTPTTRRALSESVPTWQRDTPLRLTGALLQSAMITPAFGAAR